ncbi:Uncharacterised protein [[Pasteurella] mairii]|uniref:Site-specific DNA methylase n=1 Tax=[Pasteurella] mairii TaxID=757 RepID=A0A379B6D0_9PAST|nr:Uncharacterised protein [[Pasteurella] mairii]
MHVFLKHFSQVLSDNIPNDGEGWTIVDAFGGSGLLSHTAKHLKSVKTLDELFKEDFWNCIRQTDYPSAEGYLEGIDVVCESFFTLLPKYKNDPKALFVLDPPYLCMQQANYNQENYFDLIDFLRLIKLTRPPFMFFSSTKSEFVRFVDTMIGDKWNNWRVFENYKRFVGGNNGRLLK